MYDMYSVTRFAIHLWENVVFPPHSVPMLILLIGYLVVKNIKS